MSEIIKRFYNPDNRLIKIVKYNNKEVKQTINNKYDLNGNIIEQINIHKMVVLEITISILNTILKI